LKGRMLVVTNVVFTLYSFTLMSTSEVN